MSWIDATEWVGGDKTSLWASDGKEIFQARYQASDLCETPEERLFVKEGAKLWLEVAYIWTGKGQPTLPPADTLYLLRNFGLVDLLHHRFPGLNQKNFDLIYAKFLQKLPRLPSVESLMEEAAWTNPAAPAARPR